MPRPCQLLVDDVQTESIQMSETGLRKSKYIKKQPEEFALFQDSQDTRKAYRLFSKNSQVGLQW
jgi:hypothetical protein